MGDPKISVVATPSSEIVSSASGREECPSPVHQYVAHVDMQTGSPIGSPPGSSHPLSSLHVETVAVQHMEWPPQDVNPVDDEVRL